MKIIRRLVIFFLFASCNQPNSSVKPSNPVSDTSILIESTKFFHPDPEIITHRDSNDTTIDRQIDTLLLLNVSKKILKHIKARNYRKFALFIHPQHHLRLSPYANIDTTKDRLLSAEQLLLLAKQNRKINWNSSWDTEPDLLTVDEYFKKFVYDVDFLNAEQKSINSYHSQGTDLNNIKEAYPGCDVVEFFFSGFDEKYAGHDFRGLRLVYKMKNKKPYLAGIVHDEWTP